MTAINKFAKRSALTSVGVSLLLALPAAAQQYQQVNLVTDDQTAHSATIQDPNLVNPWGVSFSASSPFWVSDNAKGVSTLYQVNPVTGTPTTLGLVVNTGGAGNPTGQAFNSLAASQFNHDNFLFVSEDGTISGWRSALGTAAETLQVGDPANVYKGTTLGVVGNFGYLYSANFKAGTIDVLKGDAAAPDLAGKFVDPNLPSGFAPFNVRNLGGRIYVTYAMQGAGGQDDVPGAGNGYVDAFDLQGNFLGRIGSQGTLNSPWGLEIAPASFGALAGDLLVGNFGDGTISAFDPNFGGFKDQLDGLNGQPLSIDGLWTLTVGNNGSAGSGETLYFTAGPDDESHGLFGLLGQVPEIGSTFTLLGLAMSGLVIFSRRIRN